MRVISSPENGNEFCHLQGNDKGTGYAAKSGWLVLKCSETNTKKR